MTEEKKHDAILKNWIISPLHINSLAGQIFGDTKGAFGGPRWEDGTSVTTSTISADQAIEEGAVIQTRNTRYLLGKRFES